MPPYKIKLLAKKEIASGTMQFEFEKPKNFSFKAGQYARMTLIEPPDIDEKGIARSLTIASAPREGRLIFAMRMRDSAFKNYLKNATIGTEVIIHGPFGDFVLPSKSERQIVFLIGGIGITPVRSMMVGAKPEQRITLFWSNHQKSDAAFYDELMSLQNENFKIIAIMTNDPGWNGENSRINREMIEKYVENPNEAIYYIAGPPMFLESMKNMLTENGITRIMEDEFEGY